MVLCMRYSPTACPNTRTNEKPRPQPRRIC